MKLIDAHMHIGMDSFCEVENSDFKYNLCSTYNEIIELMDMNNVNKAVVLECHSEFTETQLISFMKI